MKKPIYYAEDIKSIVNDAMITSVGLITVSFGYSSEEIVSRINGMYSLSEAIEKRLDKAEEEAKKEDDF